MGQNKRTKTQRRYTGGGPRPDNRKFRQEEAAARQAIYDALTTQQKLDRLPPPPACAKQRAKLTAILEGKPKTKKSEPAGATQ